MTIEVLRDDDPRCVVLEDAGNSVVGESWAARLRLSDPPDLGVLEDAVRRAAAAGLSIRELDDGFAQALFELETANEKDYPYTPATARVVGDLDRIQALWRDGARVFGALDGDQLVGATVINQSEDHGDTDFTSVLSAYRGKGVGQGVKAASILALVADGIRVFGTGGAALNDASLGANLALGYQLEERWRSYAPPADSGG